MVAFVAFSTIASADVVQTDDFIIQNSLCVGVDCINGETFGSDTIRLKENNLRIHVEDTSASGGFPANDWRFLFNETTDGGLEMFSVEDATAGNRLMLLEAGAPDNSLYMRSNGNVGLGTATPAHELHMLSGDTPTIRLDQDNSQGWGEQIWDIAANEANFFVRDATDGSKLPFRIRPGAPTSSIDIGTDGSVGFGTTSPAHPIHVVRSDGTANITVQEGSGTVAARQLYTLENNGPIGFGMVNSDTTAEWRFAAQTTGFRVSLAGSGGPEFEVQNDGSLRAGPGSAFNFNFDGSTGDLTIDGEIITGGGTCGGGCDLVFSENYQLASIEEHAAAMWENGHLPAVGPTVENGQWNLSEKVGGMLNELEMSHIYIEQLHAQVGELHDEKQELEDRVEVLERLVNRMVAEQSGKGSLAEVE